MELDGEDLEAILGFLLLGVLAIVALYRDNKDREKYGAATDRDRLRTLSYAIVWLMFFIALAWINIVAYGVLSLMVFIGVWFPIAKGKYGHWRSARDGSLLGWIVSIFGALVIYAN